MYKKLLCRPMECTKPMKVAVIVKKYRLKQTKSVLKKLLRQLCIPEAHKFSERLCSHHGQNKNVVNNVFTFLVTTNNIITIGITKGRISKISQMYLTFTPCKRQKKQKIIWELGSFEIEVKYKIQKSVMCSFYFDKEYYSEQHCSEACLKYKY